MNSDNPFRVRLAGGLDHTAPSAEVGPDGSLLVELYDFSDDAQRHFGNDVAYTLVVDPAEKGRVLALLTTEHEDNARESSPDSLLLRLMHQRFSDYFEVNAWFQEQEISFCSKFDSCA